MFIDKSKLEERIADGLTLFIAMVILAVTWCVVQFVIKPSGNEKDRVVNYEDCYVDAVKADIIGRDKADHTLYVKYNLNDFFHHLTDLKLSGAQYIDMVDENMSKIELECLYNPKNRKMLYFRDKMKLQEDTMSHRQHILITESWRYPQSKGWW